MRISTDRASAMTMPFVADAAARGARAPIRLVDQDVRGWQVAARSGDALVVDEYGELWWARISREGEAFTIRECWPEERAALSSRIRAGLRAAAR